MNTNGTRTHEILAKVFAGERVTYDEGLYLYEHADLLALGEAANARRQQINPGSRVTYLIDRNINYTNVCVTDCQFCNFYTPKSTDKKAYVNSKEILGHKIAEAAQSFGDLVAVIGVGFRPHQNHDERCHWITLAARRFSTSLGSTG